MIRQQISRYFQINAYDLTPWIKHDKTLGRDHDEYVPVVW